VMSAPAQIAGPPPKHAHVLRLHLPTVPEALASFLRTVVVALFLLTFLLQPFLIPSESMEHTLLVGDFLLVNKQIFAPGSSRSVLIASQVRSMRRRRFAPGRTILSLAGRSPQRRIQ